MNRHFVIASAFCLVDIGSHTAVQASPSRYYLQQTKHGYTVTVRLRDRTKHAIVWQREFWHMECPAFSWDHRAFAAQVRGQDTPEFALLLWQEGKPMRVLTKQTFFRDNDGIVDIAWSADKQRLALLMWAGGGSLDSQSYEIWYMNVPKEVFGFSGAGRVRHMKWAGLRQVRYRQARLRKVGVNPPDAPPFPEEHVSHVWMCP